MLCYNTITDITPELAKSVRGICCGVEKSRCPQSHVKNSLNTGQKMRKDAVIFLASDVSFGQIANICTFCLILNEAATAVAASWSDRLLAMPLTIVLQNGKILYQLVGTSTLLPILL